jgi:hypothetical protein
MTVNLDDRVSYILRILLDTGASHASYISLQWVTRHRAALEHLIHPWNAEVIMANGTATVAITEYIILPVAITFNGKTYCAFLPMAIFPMERLDGIIGNPQLSGHLGELLADVLRTNQASLSLIEPGTAAWESSSASYMGGYSAVQGSLFMMSHQPRVRQLASGHAPVTGARHVARLRPSFVTPFDSYLQSTASFPLPPAEVAEILTMSLLIRADLAESDLPKTIYIRYDLAAVLLA